MKLAVIALVVVAAAPLSAQTCPAPAGWDKPVRHLAAASSEMKFALPVGETTDLGLRVPAVVKLFGASGRKLKPGSSAGLAALDVPKPGKLDVVLSNATYVDLFRDGKRVKSSSFAMPKDCKGVRKSVTFDVTPGRYIVQLTDAPQRRVKIATVLR